MGYDWEYATDIGARQFTCGYCHSFVASDKGWDSEIPRGGLKASIYICPSCGLPTTFAYNMGQVPDVPFGNPVREIPDASVAELYEEARRTTSVNCYTATILCCRKLLMHIAVSLGADEGENFVEYVNYLNNNHYISPKSKKWIDHIRKMGNQANHEINIGKKEDAEELLTFIEMLLKFNFEFPGKMDKKIQLQQKRSKPTN